MSEYIEAVGRRKSATARVRIYPGEGEIIVNDLPMTQYFGREMDQVSMRQPLIVVGREGSYNISVHVKGGGEGGQAEAARHGLSRALVEADASLRSVLKSAGFLTRDPRVKERKKPGLKRARKAPQYTKR
jgi:small subunit ribosomal protein S9